MTSINKDDILKNIFKWFLGPLVKRKPNNINLENWLELTLKPDFSPIVRYLCTQSFKVSADFQVTTNRIINEILNIKKGDEVWVRSDKNKNIIEMELFFNEESKEYLLSKDNWRFKVKPYLKQVSFKDDYIS